MNEVSELKVKLVTTETKLEERTNNFEETRKLYDDIKVKYDEL